MEMPMRRGTTTMFKGRDGAQPTNNLALEHYELMQRAQDWAVSRQQQARPLAIPTEPSKTLERL
jgi:hypothetical protein